MRMQPALRRLYLALTLFAALVLWAGLVRADEVEVDGGTLYYQTFSPSDGSNGEPIIVLHGGPGLDQSYLLPQMANLGRDNTVSFYDQRGSGKSLGFNLDPKTINMTVFVDDLEAVRIKLGYDKFTLIGHSWGGLLAMNYAIEHQDHLNSMILVSSAPATSAGFNSFVSEYKKRTAPMKDLLAKIEASQKYKQGDPDVTTDHLRRVFSLYFYKPSDVKQLTLQSTPESFKSGSKVAEILATNYLAKYDLKAQLKTLTIPVLLVHGRTDIVPLSTAQETQAAIPGAQLVILEECDHFPYIEQPNKFFAAVRSFLKARV